MGFFSRKQDQTEAPAQAGRRSSRRRAPASFDEDTDDAFDPAQEGKKRARRRLLGAVALVIGAVVFLPMVLDSEPKAPNQELSVVVPDKDTPFTPKIPHEASPEPSAPNAVPPAAPARTEAAPSPVVGASTAPGPVVTPSASEPAKKDSQRASDKTTQKAPAKAPVDASAATTHAKDAEKSADHGNDPRAIAALEGKDIAPTQKEKTSAGTASAGYVVQIGAFASAAKAAGLRNKLVAAGLKSFTEVSHTSEGTRTRVRLGPYSSREAAEKARAKVHTIGLDGSVMPL